MKYSVFKRRIRNERDIVLKTIIEENIDSLISNNVSLESIEVFTKPEMITIRVNDENSKVKEISIKRNGKSLTIERTYREN